MATESTKSGKEPFVRPKWSVTSLAAAMKSILCLLLQDPCAAVERAKFKIEPATNEELQRQLKEDVEIEAKLREHEEAAQAAAQSAGIEVEGNITAGLNTRKVPDLPQSRTAHAKNRKAVGPTLSELTAVLDAVKAVNKMLENSDDLTLTDTVLSSGTTGA